MFKIILKLDPAPPTGLYSPVAPLREMVWVMNYWKLKGKQSLD